MVAPAAVVGLALAIALLIARRGPDGDKRRLAVFLTVLAAAWIGLVAVMTVRGFSGNQRYLMVPAALITVLGASGIVWTAQLAIRRPLNVAITAAAAVALAVVFVAPDADALPDTLRGTKYQVQLVDDLEKLVDDAGGRKPLLRCGHLYTGPFLVPQVAWRMHVHINQVDLTPEPPAVVFHVKTIKRANHFSPGIAAGAPHILARRGGWVLSSECPR
jgi:hypothetical protein